MSIIEFLAGIPVNAVLRERIAALIEDNERLSKQVVELEQENAALKKQEGSHRSQILAASSPAEFEEHRGALFKRKPGGGYHLAVYCPNCKRSASSFHVLPYECSCGWSGDF